MKRNQEGFTLIELLVVVAIIGILSGIAFVSIRGARESAYDTQIKSELSQIRSNAEQWYYDNGGQYSEYDTNTASGWNNIKDAIPPCSQSHLDSNVGGVDSEDEYQIVVHGQAYVAWAPLCGATEVTNDPVYYCIDSDGNAGEYTNLINADTGEVCFDGTIGVFGAEN